MRLDFYFIDAARKHITRSKNMLNQQKDNYVISGICSKLAVKDTYHIVRQ